MIIKIINRRKIATINYFNSTKRDVSAYIYQLLFKFFSKLLGAWPCMNQGKLRSPVGNNLIGSGH